MEKLKHKPNITPKLLKHFVCVNPNNNNIFIDKLHETSDLIHVDSKNGHHTWFIETVKIKNAITLDKYLEKKLTFSLDELKTLLDKIVEMNTEFKIYHTDLHLGNILLKLSNDGNIETSYIIDFGMVWRFHEQKKFSKMTDIFTLWEQLKQQEIFKPKDLNDMFLCTIRRYKLLDQNENETNDMFLKRVEKIRNQDTGVLILKRLKLGAAALALAGGAIYSYKNKKTNPTNTLSPSPTIEPPPIPPSPTIEPLPNPPSPTTEPPPSPEFIPTKPFPQIMNSISTPSTLESKLNDPKRKAATFSTFFYPKTNCPSKVIPKIISMYDYYPFELFHPGLIKTLNQDMFWILVIKYAKAQLIGLTTKISVDLRKCVFNLLEMRMIIPPNTDDSPYILGFGYTHIPTGYTFAPTLQNLLDNNLTTSTANINAVDMLCMCALSVKLDLINPCQDYQFLFFSMYNNLSLRDPRIRNRLLSPKVQSPPNLYNGDNPFVIDKHYSEVFTILKRFINREEFSYSEFKIYYQKNVLFVLMRYLFYENYYETPSFVRYLSSNDILDGFSTPSDQQVLFSLIRQIDLYWDDNTPLKNSELGFLNTIKMTTIIPSTNQRQDIPFDIKFILYKMGAFKRFMINENVKQNVKQNLVGFRNNDIVLNDRFFRTDEDMDIFVNNLLDQNRRPNNVINQFLRDRNTDINRNV